MRYNILIVDDEPANVRALQRLFRDEYEVVTAFSGADALELLQHNDVQLMITDQRMPEMTGIELLKKTVSLRPRMIRILLTGYTDVDALVEAINCGQVYRYVTKPWNNEDLRVTVRRALEHFETNRNGYELTLAHERLLSRMRDINRLASLDTAS